MTIAVAGNIGAGKSTLVSKLANYYDYTPIYEAVGENPYLEDFYDDMHRWAFPLQIRFLTLRFRQAKKVQTTNTHAILDRTIYEDAQVFAKNLYQNGLMNERDYQTYLLLYHTLISEVEPPQVLVFLKGSVKTLSQRIERRNSEKKMQNEKTEFVPDGYLNQLNDYYNLWIDQFNLCPVLTVNIEDVDLHQNQDFHNLTEMIDSI